jgi:hypothetical protein
VLEFAEVSGKCGSNVARSYDSNLHLFSCAMPMVVTNVASAFDHARFLR